MAKKPAPKIHPLTACDALKAFTESVGLNLAVVEGIAQMLDETTVTPGMAKEYAKRLRAAVANVSAHFEEQ